MLGKAFAPNRRNTVDIGLRSRPYLEAGVACFAGNNPALGLSSLRYSAIASVSHTLIPSWVRHGTKIDGESSNNSARFAGSSTGTACSTNSNPAILHNSQPRSDQEE